MARLFFRAHAMEPRAMELHRTIRVVVLAVSFLKPKIEGENIFLIMPAV